MLPNKHDIVVTAEVPVSRNHDIRRTISRRAKGALHCKDAPLDSPFRPRCA
jgi:hypothetical protein